LCFLVLAIGSLAPVNSNFYVFLLVRFLLAGIVPLAARVALCLFYGVNVVYSSVVVVATSSNNNSTTMKEKSDAGLSSGFVEL
jgi:hypothetical protein